MIKIAVSGSEGRMGKRIKELVNSDPHLELAGYFDINDDPNVAIENCDVLIEFTAPEATMKNLEIAKNKKRAIVIGTTGLNDKQIGVIKE